MVNKMAGVIVDAHALEVFEGAFKRAGFKWGCYEGTTLGTLVLEVGYNDLTLDKLQKVIEATNEVAQQECFHA